ncbi:Ribonucleases P/MRP protein subunit POP6 [Nakaseomyces bracarensis]|uniref:Ribonucleases P/MRP protein subunit POP6 n=1 Tax=Nakaseomyces bracarensis TaxID=273131 RepID=A0ABR4NV95_9SACH
MTNRVLYNGLDTQLSLDNYSQCFDFIKAQIIPNILSGNVIVEKITKNDKISNRVSRLETVLKEKRIIVVVSYGDHIQKMASIVEITKSKFEGVDQWNKLLSFQQIRPGKNELLEKAVRVPILITVLCVDKKLELPQELKVSSSGFFKQ